MKEINTKLIIVTLFIIAFFLLIANIIASMVMSDSDEKTNDSEIIVENLSQREIDSLFIDILKDFDIDTLYTKKILKKREIVDSVKFIYKVVLPNDLPSPLVLQEMKNSFGNLGFDFTAVETKLHFDTKVEISKKHKSRLKAEFSTDLDVQRIKGYIGFFITNFESLSEIEKTELLENTEIIGIQLIPTKEAKETKKRFSENRKDCGILISDDISDIDYKVHSSYSKDRLLLAVRLLIGAFPDKNYFVIDNDTEIYNSNAFAYLESEFNKRGYKIIPTHKFDLIEGESEELVIHKFKTISKKAFEGQNILFELTYDNYKKIQNPLKELKKKGVKVMYPSNILTD